MLLNLSYKMLTAMIVQVIVSPCEPSHDWMAKIFQQGEEQTSGHLLPHDPTAHTRHLFHVQSRPVDAPYFDYTLLRPVQKKPSSKAATHIS